MICLTVMTGFLIYNFKCKRINPTACQALSGQILIFFKGFLSFTKIFCASKLVKIQVVYLGTALPTGAEKVWLVNSSEPERAEISNI